ncbi:MAG TPA: DUF4326 domain-containing protein [Planctomycetota bacterium]|nr:DUF4326 domain-containing protein [Planctomycetota bacterium]
MTRGPRKTAHPRRVVARRDRDYRLVARPTRWGNPFPVETWGREESMRRYAAWLDERLRVEPDFLEPLRGYRLGCFCPAGVPCHADEILRRLYGR